MTLDTFTKMGNSNIFDMIRQVKRYCKVGITTNGVLLTEDVIKKLVDYGIDVHRFEIHLVEFCANIGVDEFIVDNLVYVMNEE